MKSSDKKMLRAEWREMHRLGFKLRAIFARSCGISLDKIARWPVFKMICVDASCPLFRREINIIAESVGIALQEQKCESCGAKLAIICVADEYDAQFALNGKMPEQWTL